MDSVFPPTVLQRLQSEVIDPTGVAGGIVGPVGFELRHISGLNAGAAHPIAAGGISFSAADGEPGFRLDADADGAIVVTPLALPVRLDNRPIDGPRQVGDAVLDVGFAAFTVASRRSTPPRSPGTPADPERTLNRRPATTGQVSIPVNGIEERELIRLVQLEYQSALFHAREMWPDPEEIMFQIFEQGSRVWSEPVSDPAFGHAAVALGTLPWQPELSRPLDLSPDTFSKLKGYQALPSVPVVADFSLGPVGLVGPREMTLAVARQLVLNRAVLSSPHDLAVGIIANSQSIADWAWIEPLPHLARQSGPRRPLRVLDDPDRPTESAEVIISTDMDLLPERCALSVEINPDGTCTVIDNGTGSVTMAAMPLGLHPDLALAATGMLSRLVDAVPTRVPSIPKIRSRSPIGSAPLAMGYESSFF